MRKPTFSVIIPTLNEEKFLPKLLDSLITQTNKDFEVIVVDGPSRDKTRHIVKSYLRKLRLTLVESKIANLSLQRNLGARRASGKWLLFLDSDDVLLPYAMFRCSHFIETHPDVKFFTSWFTPDSELSSDAVIILLSNLFIESGKIVKRQIAPGPFAAVRNDIFMVSGGYEESRGYGEDQEFSMRLFEQGIPLDFLRETLYVYSLRRFRRQGTLRMLQLYATNSLIALVTKRAPKYMPGYIMGGHLYNKKQVKRSVIKKYEQKIKMLMKELFA